MFFLVPSMKNHQNISNQQKSLKTSPKKYFKELSGACSTQQLVKIHHSVNSMTRYDRVTIILDQGQGSILYKLGWTFILEIAVFNYAQCINII